MSGTPNHEYNVPDEGAQNWHEPLNQNFEALDVDVELRDEGPPDEADAEYEPEPGMKYLDTESGVVYVGGFGIWHPTFVLAGHEGDDEAIFDLAVALPALDGDLTDGERLHTIAGDNLAIDDGALTADVPDDAGNWVVDDQFLIPDDDDILGIQVGQITADGDISFGGVLDGDVGGSIDDWSSAADLDESGAVTAALIESLAGGEGIDPADIGDGDTLSVAWDDADDLDASGAVTAALVESLVGGEGIDPADIGDGDELSVAWEDADDLDETGTVTVALIESLFGGDGINPTAIEDGDELSVAWDDADDLDASGGVTVSFVESLVGGNGIDPTAIEDGDTLSVAWDDADDLDETGAITAALIESLAGGEGIDPADIGDGDTLSVAWEDANDLDENGNVVNGGGGDGRYIDDGDFVGPAEWENAGDTATNEISGDAAAVTGGKDNVADGSNAIVAGGEENEAVGSRCIVSGGRMNLAEGLGCTIGGGINNTADNGVAGSYVFSGQSNTASGRAATICAGESNEAESDFSFIGGGSNNTASLGGDVIIRDGEELRGYGTAVAGHENEVSGTLATVVNGSNNVASGTGATIPGGIDNVARGDFSFAVGNNATAAHDGAVVFGDSSDAEISSAGPDETRFQTEVYAPAVHQTSARAAKTGVEPVDPQSVLDGVESLDITTWEFTDTDDGRHIGPMAEEFADAFDVGADAETIATIDADGVALAAIQALSERLEQKSDEIDRKDDRIDQLEDRIESKDDRIDELEERLTTLEEQLEV